MKKQISTFTKRFVTLLLVTLMITGMMPAETIADMFDVSLTASADTLSSGGSLSGLSVGTYVKKGASLYAGNTSFISIDGTIVKTVSNGAVYVTSKCLKYTGKKKGATTASGDTYYFSTGKPTPTVSVSGKTMDYNGSSRALVSGSTNGGTLQYSMDGSSWSTSVPYRTNAGTYTVYYRVVGDDNWNSVSAKTVTSTIRKAAPSLSAPTAKSMPYNGSAQSLANAGSASGGTLQYSSNNSSWGTSIPTGTNVGSYPVYYRVIGDSNHTNIDSRQLTSNITKVAPALTAPKAKTMPYTGAAQDLVTAGTVQGGTLYYSLDEKTWSTSIPKGTNVNSYKVYYKVTGDANHSDIASESVTSSITKAPPKLTAPVVKSIPYTGSAQQLVVPGSAEGGTLQYSTDGTNWGTTIPTGVNVGSYPVMFRVIGDANHSDIPAATITSTITKVPATLTDPKEKAMPYNGSAQELATAGSAKGGTLYYSLDNTNWSKDIPKGTTAGNYTIYYKVTGDSNHSDVGPKSIISTITKITPDVTEPKNTIHKYNGQEQQLADTPATTTGGTLKYSLDGDKWDDSVPKAADINKYKIYYKVIGDENYNDVDAQYVDAEITAPDIDVVPPQGKNLTYNKEEQELITAGSSSQGTMMYSLDQENWQKDIPTGKEAGDYKIYYKVVGEGIVFPAQSVNSTIAKITPDVTPPKNTVHEYNGREQQLADTPATTTGGTLRYSLDGTTWIDTVPKAKDIGAYKIYYKVMGDNNYNDVASAFVDAEITEKTIDVTPPQGKNLTYNTKAQQLITPGTTSKGTMKYSLDQKNWKEDIPTGTEAGEYTIYYTVEGDGINFTPKSVKSTISKANPDVTPPKDTSHVYNGEDQPLADTPATTTAGTIKYSTDGENWQDTIPKAKDIGEYKIYYKVIGNDNYNDVEPKYVDAEITKKPVEVPKGTITVLGIDKEDTPKVVAYQIIDGVYDKDGTLVNYVLRSELGDLKIENMSQPTEDEIAAISGAIRTGKITLEPISMTRIEESETPNTVSYTADVEPGMYLVLVSDTKVGYIYNPAVVSINIDDNSHAAVNGSVDMTTYFDYPPKAYIKSSRVKVDKSIIDENGNKTNGYSAAFGETVNFRIDNITIPSYSHDYTAPKYIITDTLKGSAFDGIKNMTVKIDGTALTPSADTFSLVGKDKSGNDVAVEITDSGMVLKNATTFILSFAQSYLYDNEGKSVVIDYSSVITDTAGYNYSENQNVVKVEFSNTPDTTAEIKDVTYHYTFGISAKIDAEDDNPDPNQNKNRYIIYEINKTSEECYEYEEVIDGEGNIIQKNKKALPGAQFTLYNNYRRSESDIVATSVSNEYGGVSFIGLKAGTYYLAETKPPVGYSLKDTVYRIDIVPTFDERGIMINYTVNTCVAGENGEKGAAVQSASYSNTPTVNEDGSVTNNIVIVNDNSSKFAIINTTLSKLPTTGGMGTVLITIMGSVGMAYFFTMFIMSRKKKLI